MVYYACGRKSMKRYKRIFWRMVDHASMVVFRAVTNLGCSQYTHKYRMQLAYNLTAPLLALRMGPGRTPSDKSLLRLRGKHFASYHSESTVCAYKRKGPHSKRRKDTKTKNYCAKCDVHLCHGLCFQRYHTLVKY